MTQQSLYRGGKTQQQREKKKQRENREIERENKGMERMEWRK